MAIIYLLHLVTVENIEIEPSYFALKTEVVVPPPQLDLCQHQSLPRKLFNYQ